MKSLKKIIQGTYFFVLFMLIFTVPSYAYIDPSSGSIVIQAIVAAFIAAGAGVKIFWNKITGIFKKKD